MWGFYCTRSLAMRSLFLHATLVLLVLCARANASSFEDLLNASKVGDLEGIQMLVEAGVNIDNGGDLKTKVSPLMLAAEEGKKEAVQLLISLGANIDGKLPRFRERSPLHRAIANNHIEIVKILIQEGADVNIPTRLFVTPILEAAKLGREDALQLLLDAGAVVNWFNFFESTALHEAASAGHVGVVQSLIRAGADVNFPDVSLRTPLHVASVGGHATVVRELIDAGSDVHALMASNLTSLLQAARFGHFEAVEILLDAGADIEHETHTGQSAFDFASGIPTENGQKTAKILRERGAKTDGLGLYLWNVAKQNRLDAAKALIEAGADVNFFNPLSQSTPLLGIAGAGDSPMVQLLIENGADLCLKDGKGRTAYDLVNLKLQACPPQEPSCVRKVPDSLKCV